MNTRTRIVLIVVIFGVAIAVWPPLGNVLSGGGTGSAGGGTGTNTSPTTGEVTSPSPTQPVNSESQLPGIPNNAVAMTVDYVHDGDTLFLTSQDKNSSGDQIKVRLIGIDTPEVTEPQECYGSEATQRLRQLLPENSTVWASTDDDPFDNYQRWLLYLWTSDGTFVNYEMVSGGFAEAIRVKPNTLHWDLLHEAEQSAQNDRVGLWGACDWP